MPGAPARRPAAAEHHQPGGAVPVPGVGGEQLQHAGVVGLPPGQRPADRPGQMDVADRHRVGVAAGPLARLGRGPGADPGQRAQAQVRLGGGHPGDLLQPLRHVGGADDGPGADALHACPVPRPGGNPRPGTGGREDPHPGRGRPRRRLPVPEHERPPGPACLGPDDLLLQHGRHQRLKHPARPADPEIARTAGPSRPATGAPAGSRSGRRPRPAARAERRAPRRRRGPRPRRAPSCRHRGPGGPVGRDPQRGRAVRGARCPPHRAGRLDPEGWITGPPPVHPQRSGPGPPGTAPASAR